MLTSREAGLEPIARVSLTGVLCLSVVGGVAWGFREARESALFRVRSVEVADLPEASPVTAAEVSALTGIQVGEERLLSLDLGSIERRLLTHPWIREAAVRRRLPQAVTVEVQLHEPQALLEVDGRLSYVDRDGVVFGTLDLRSSADLPVVSGVGREESDRLREIARFLEAWQSSSLGRTSEISGLVRGPGNEFRALIVYPLKVSRPTRLDDSTNRSSSRARAWVELGQDLDGETEIQLERLRGVLQYLSERGVAARQIWANVGKKIVVKIARGS